jgi:uncharacterized protein (UPF0335 family)
MKDITTSISINGGPAIPVDLDAVKRGLRHLHADAARTAASRGPNTDLEEFAPAPLDSTKVGGIAADRLRSVVERIERLEEERKALASDIKDIYAETKSAGFNVSVVRQIIRDRKKDTAEREEWETLLDLYRNALGM